MFKKIYDWLVLNFCYSSEVTLMKQEIAQKKISLNLLKEAYDNLEEEYVKFIIQHTFSSTSTKLNKKVYDKVTQLFSGSFSVYISPINEEIKYGKKYYKWTKMSVSFWLLLYRNDIYVPQKCIIWKDSK